MHYSFRDEEERRRWQNPEEILADAGVQPNTIFIDLGCGSGFFAVPAAKIIGPKGVVCGVDTDSEALDELRKRAFKADLLNIRVKQAPAEDVFLCKRCADVAFIGIALHDFKDPLKVLQNVKRALKPSGRPVNLDWKKEPMLFGPPLEIRFSEKEAASLIIEAGFDVESVKSSGPYHYIISAH